MYVARIDKKISARDLVYTGMLIASIKKKKKNVRIINIYANISMKATTSLSAYSGAVSDA